ncbi:DUF6300 family protein [Plantactinospora sp. CA-290183]|uniref:DUF6300 family protein n=1 Tax=Plantactinospora sp. CA-290183 TaxID=3240006 RepID=UPI003D8C7D49
MHVNVENDDELVCPTCGQEPCLAASLPTPAGHTSVILCPRCNANSPAADTVTPLLAWFALHEAAIDQNLDELAALVRRWLEEVSRPSVPDAALRAALRQWERRAVSLDGSQRA